MKRILFFWVILGIMMSIGCSNIITQKSDPLSDISEQIQKDYNISVKLWSNRSAVLPGLNVEFNSKDTLSDLLLSQLVLSITELILDNELNYSIINVKISPTKNQTFDVNTNIKVLECMGKSRDVLFDLTNTNMSNFDPNYLDSTTIQNALLMMDSLALQSEFIGFQTGRINKVTITQLYFKINSKDIGYFAFDVDDTDNKIIGIGVNP